MNPQPRKVSATEVERALVDARASRWKVRQAKAEYCLAWCVLILAWSASRLRGLARRVEGKPVFVLIVATAAFGLAALALVLNSYPLDRVLIGAGGAFVAVAAITAFSLYCPSDDTLRESLAKLPATLRHKKERLDGLKREADAADRQYRMLQGALESQSPAPVRRPAQESQSPKPAPRPAGLRPGTAVVVLGVILLVCGYRFGWFSQPQTESSRQTASPGQPASTTADTSEDRRQQIFLAYLDALQQARKDHEWIDLERRIEQLLVGGKVAEAGEFIQRQEAIDARYIDRLVLSRFGIKQDELFGILTKGTKSRRER